MCMDRTCVMDTMVPDTCAALTAHPCEASVVTVSILQMGKLRGRGGQVSQRAGSRVGLERRPSSSRDLFATTSLPLRYRG